MHRDNTGFVVRSQASLLSTHKVLRNTYMLLGLTFLFSGFMAFAGMAMGIGHVGLIIFFIGAYGLMFLTERFKNSPLGIVFVFAFTGFMGLTLAPLISHYLAAFSNGGQIVMTALGGTGAIFFGLSGYTLITRKDFNFLGGFIFAGFMVVMLTMLANIFFQIPGIQLAISAAVMLLSSGAILYQTSEIIHGGETNYISATVSLYVSIYNIFVSLLQLLGAFGSDD